MNLKDPIYLQQPLPFGLKLAFRNKCVQFHATLNTRFHS
jgi:hypothetical protein